MFMSSKMCMLKHQIPWRLYSEIELLWRQIRLNDRSFGMFYVFKHGFLYFQTVCSISLIALEFQYIVNIKMRADILILFLISEESIQFLTTEYDVSYRVFWYMFTIKLRKFFYIQVGWRFLSWKLLGFVRWLLSQVI